MVDGEPFPETCCVYATLAGHLLQVMYYLKKKKKLKSLS